PALCRSFGCLRSAGCSSWSRCSCRTACWAWPARDRRTRLPRRRYQPDRPTRSRAAGRRSSAVTELVNSLLYLDGVTVSFDGFRALNNLSLVVARGEMRAIIGPNGAGKTTMMDVITGKTRPDSGDVLFDGSHDLTKLEEAAIAELGIGRKFQRP